MNNVCPLCNGDGKRMVQALHHASGGKKMAMQLCLCKKSLFVSESSYARILAPLGPDYMPLEQIDPQLVFDPNNLSRSPNLIIKADFETFSLNLKSIIMKYRFDYPVLVYACRAIDILQKFYVPQPDGNTLHLSELDRFHLLAFTMDTEEKNDKLKTVIAQVVYTRICARKPTWIFLPTTSRPTLEQCKQEYSQELEEYVKTHYTEVILQPKTLKRTSTGEKVTKKGSNFTVKVTKKASNFKI